MNAAEIVVVLVIFFLVLPSKYDPAIWLKELTDD